MTELKRFLVAIYDALSEAEVEALIHGQSRLAELVESGDVPPETASVPVYHAADVDVTLDVDLRVEETDSGVDVYVTDSGTDSDSELTFTVELFELLERQDLENVDYDDVLDTIPRPSGTGSDRDTRRGGQTDDEGVSGDEEEVAADEEESGDGEETAVDGETSDGTGRADDSDPVETIDGIGPTYGERLRDRGIGTVADLAAESPETVAGLASTADQTVSTERAAAWIEAATARRSGRATDDTDDRHT